jgi:GST-like protein
MVAEIYTIVDMDVWGWARMVPFVLGEDAWAKLPNVKRLHDEIMARPAAQRALALKDKFTFKATMDDEARRHMFKHLAGSAA